jgi:hypothetical protein
MKQERVMKTSKSCKRAGLGAFGGILLAILMLAPPAMSAEEAMDTTFDNLVPVKGAKMSMAYIDPEADFSVFKRVAILEPFSACLNASPSWSPSWHSAATGSATRTAVGLVTSLPGIWSG